MNSSLFHRGMKCRNNCQSKQEKFLYYQCSVTEKRYFRRGSQKKGEKLALLGRSVTGLPWCLRGFNIFPVRSFLVAQLVKNPPAMQEIWVQSLDWEDPLEKEMAIHSSILAWRIPWTEEPGGLQSMGLQSEITEPLTFTLESCHSSAIAGT